MKKQPGIMLAILLHTCVYGQQNSKVKFGIQMGAAFGNTKIEYANQQSNPDLTTKTGFTGGFFLNYSVNKSLLLQPALLYVRKGAQQKTQSSFSYRYKYNYLEMPLNILCKNKIGSSTFGAGAGLSPAFKLTDIAPAYELKSFDLGINALVMYQAPIGFSVNLRYTYGLLNTSTSTNNADKIRNKYFSLAIGYEF